jgi:L-ribulose-5-phosphate 3-epimerase
LSIKEQEGALNKDFSRRSVLGAAAASLMFAGEKGTKPRLGVVTQVSGKNTPEQGIAKAHALGVPTCQAALGPAPDMSSASALRAALDKYSVEATAVMTLGPGQMVWDFYSGPKTIGLVPASTRAARIDALQRASDLAKACGIGAVHTHCGFIPENPNDPLYEPTISAIQEVATHCKANGQIFLMETGQESPITLLRAIGDAGTGNIHVNLDTANLILYGKGDPVGALDVIGEHVRGLHAKDGVYPVDPKKLGRETAIGQGKVDFRTVIAKLHSLNYTGPITIEREISGAQQEADIRRSVAYLQGLIDSTYA